MEKTHNKVIIAIAIPVFLIGIGVGLKVPLLTSSSIPKANGIVFSDARPITDFKLVDHDDLTFDLERLQGYWSLVYFGYSHCPDLCPMALSQLGQMSKNFQNKGGVSVQYIFVSVDPDRDTVDKLKSYVKFFSPDLLGVTGSTEQLKKLSSQLAIGFEVHPKTDANYLVDHSNTILLLSPTGKFQAVFTAPHTAHRLEADVRAINKWYLGLN